MKKIRNIHVPIDFSLTARNAYRYAKSLAKELNATLTVVNIKENLIMVSDVMIAPLPFEDNEEMVKDIEKFIEEEDAAMNTITVKNEVKIKIFKGHPVDVLTGLSESNDIDLIVMGTTGFADVLTKLFGSTSIKVSNQARCPVILIPQDARWHPIDKIMYSSNYDSMSSKTIGEMTNFALNLNADVHFVNVKNFDPVFEIKQKEFDWNELFESIDPGLTFEKHTIYGNDTIEELKNYTLEKEIDLIVFVTKHRNFWENLVHSSITENMALSIAKPLMIMHIDDQL